MRYRIAILSPMPSTPLPQKLEMEHLQRALGEISGRDILDFGAGSGRVSFFFLKQGFNVTAVDVSQKSLNDLHDAYRANKRSSWGKLTTATVIPKGKQFDAIVGADILHHIDIPQYLPGFYQALKPGGRLAFSEPNAYYPLWYVFILWQCLPWRIERGILQCRSDYLRNIFRDAGFSHLSIEGHGILPTPLLNPFPSLSRTNVSLAKRVPFLSFRLIITGNKK